jgi:serine/threonine protein phosphatase PrpC
VKAELPVRLSAGGSTQAARGVNSDHLIQDASLGLFAVLSVGNILVTEGWRAGRVGGEAIQRVITEGKATEPIPLIKMAIRGAGETLEAARTENGWDFVQVSVVLAVLRDGRIHVCWLGDCMAHRISEDQVEPLTWPHTARNRLLRDGLLTAEEEKQTISGFLTTLAYFLRGPLPEPLEIISFTPRPGDRLVLTTKGVHDVLAPSTLLDTCQTHHKPQACAERLVGLAREQGSHDHRTCIVIAFEGTGDNPPPEPRTPQRPRWQFWR